MLAPLLVAVALVTSPPLPPTTATSASAPAPASDEAWYGGPAVATEAASLGVLLLTDAVVVGQRSLLASPLVVAGIAGFALGGPVNHAVHGHLGRAWGSLGLRLGAFAIGTVGAFLVAAGEQCFGEETPTCSGGPIALAFALPIVVAYVADDVFWARGPAPRPTAPSPRRADALAAVPRRRRVAWRASVACVTAAAGLFLLADQRPADVHSAELAVSPAPPGGLRTPSSTWTRRGSAGASAPSSSSPGSAASASGRICSRPTPRAARARRCSRPGPTAERPGSRSSRGSDVRALDGAARRVYSGRGGRGDHGG